MSPQRDPRKEPRSQTDTRDTTRPKNRRPQSFALGYRVPRSWKLNEISGLPLPIYQAVAAALGIRYPTVQDALKVKDCQLLKQPGIRQLQIDQLDRYLMGLGHTRDVS